MDPSTLRASIPALEHCTYLNTGACGPSPRHVLESMETALEYQEVDAPAGEGMYAAAGTVYETARSTIADLLGCSPGEVALTESTTDGINRVATAIDWEPGDVVVRTDVEHAAGILPWQRLARDRGIEVRTLETDGGHLDLDAVRAHAEEARLIVLSSITWTHGTQLPVAEVVEIAHEAEALVLVDAVQSVGQTPVDVHEWGADFVAAAGHKWLLGPFGSGFLYVREAVADDLEPAAVGYRSVEDPNDAAGGLRYAPGAKRFEVGTTNPAAHAGLVAAIDCLRTVGLEHVDARIEALADRLKVGVPAARLVSPREHESGLVTIAVNDPEATVERLGEAGVVVRAIPGFDAIRASVHAFNAPEDVDALLERL